MKMKRNNSYSKKDLLLNANWKEPTISIFLCFSVLFLVVAINLFVRKLPSEAIQKDMTTSGIFSLSADTKDIINSLEDEINIYWICPKGKENSRTDIILKRYADESEKISFSQIDPAYFPNFVSNHSNEDSLTYNSIIVESAKRSQIIKYGDYNTSSFFLLEDYLNSALKSVTADHRPIIYSLDGHGEKALSDEMVSEINLNGFDVDKFSFVKSNFVPDDVQLLLIINPQNDLTKDESRSIVSYLENGGSLLLATGFSPKEMPNIDFIMENYGLERVSGYLCESENGAYYSSQTYIVPSVVNNVATASVTEGVAYVLTPVAHGIKQTDIHRNSLSIYPILKTSDLCYSKQNLESMDTSFEIGDIEGPFNVGVVASENVSGNETRVIWFSSSAMLDSSVDAVVSGTNTLLFLNAINYLSGNEVATLHAKATDTGTLTIMPQTKAIWSAIMLGIIPSVFIATGIIVCVYRRRR